MATFADPGTTSVSAEEVKSDMDEPLAPKRKPELISTDRDSILEVSGDSNKKQKLEISSVNKDDPLSPDVEDSKGVDEAKNNGMQLKKEVEEREKDGDDEDEEDYEDEDEEEDDDDDDDDDDSEDEDDEQSDGNADVVDPKGKGILKDEKGKGKLIEESEDSSNYGTESDGDSDLSDDPLAEVDLDNILPSRTRRRAFQSGIHLSKDQESKGDDDSTS